MPYKQTDILLSLYSGSGTDCTCRVGNCPTGTRMPGICREEFWFLLCSWMAQSLTLLRTLLPRQSTFALLPLQARCWALPHRLSRCFPHRRQGNALKASGSEAEDATPPHHPAPSALIKLALVAMFHLTSPKEFTFLVASAPLPLFFESLSLQEREAWATEQHTVLGCKTKIASD